MGASPGPGEAREAARGSADTSREGRPLLGPLVPAHIRTGGLLGGTGPVQRLSRGPQSSARRRSVTRPQAQLLKARAACRAITQTQQRPFLPVAGLAAPGRAWESWLRTLPPRTRCQDSRPASVSEPSFPRSQSQVQTGLPVAPLALVLFQFLFTPSPVSAGGGLEPQHPRSSGWRREGKASGRQAGEAHTAQPQGAGLGFRLTSSGRRGFPERSQAAAPACDTARETEVMGREAEGQRARGAAPTKPGRGSARHARPDSAGPHLQPPGQLQRPPGARFSGSLQRVPVILYNFTPNSLVLAISEQERKIIYAFQLENFL